VTVVAPEVLCRALRELIHDFATTSECGQSIGWACQALTSNTFRPQKHASVICVSPHKVPELSPAPQHPLLPHTKSDSTIRPQSPCVDQTARSSSTTMQSEANKIVKEMTVVTAAQLEAKIILVLAGTYHTSATACSAGGIVP
jgi:hypothetical protein